MYQAWVPDPEYGSKRRVGYMLALLEPYGLVVQQIEVDRGERRQGIATAVYETAARDACENFGVPLHSDVYRTAASQMFWEKQQARGRAVCIEACEPHGECAPTEHKLGRGGCTRYRLSCPAPTSLGFTRKQN